MAIAQIKNGPVTYIGFEEKDNGKFFLSDEGGYIRLRYQADEFTQALFTLTKVTKDNLQKQLDNRYFSKRDIPASIMEHINNGGTAYWYCGDPFTGPLNRFGTDPDKIIKAKKEQLLRDYSQK